MPLRVGVDLGGTKIEAMLLGADGLEVLRRRVPTPAGDYPGTIEAVAGLVEALEREAGARAPAVGVGMPGALSPRTGLVQNANSTCLIGKPFDRDLSARLGRPVRLANDADCFALSEAVDGAAAGRKVVFGVILGTGVGGGIVVDGKLVSGPNAIAGEWGHNPLPWPEDAERPGPECYCGRRGCVETFLSGPGLRRDTALEPAGAMRRYEDRLARALAVVINILDPHAIVLGGGLSNLDGLYTDVPPLWKGRVFCAEPATELLKAKYGDSSGVRGACWLC